MTQETQLAKSKSTSIVKIEQNSQQRILILAAIKGEKILAALNKYTLNEEMLLADNTFLPVIANKKESAMLVVALLKEVCTHIKNDFTDQTLAEDAILLVDEFSNWKPEEFAIFCREIIKGKYLKSKTNQGGKIFGMLDTRTLFEAAHERNQAREERWQKIFQNRQFKDGKPNRPDISETENQNIKKIFEELKKKTTPSTRTENSYQAETNALAQKIMKEFDQRHRDETNGIYSGGQRYVSYNQQMMNESEYLKVRFEELKPKK